MDKVLKRFTEILCGTLDNQEQVDKERAQGKQLHPYAKHITDICDHVLINRPVGHDGIYVLEESYYTYPGKKVDIKPLIFYLRSDGRSKVFLESIKAPHLDPTSITNDNDNLVLDYDKLVVGPFGVAEYTLQVTDQFTVNHIADLGNGLTFQLTETLSDGHLSVMELVRQNGVKITPYDTPIDYIKIE